MHDTYSSSQTGAASSAEDYRKYDQIWRRVSPDLNPYPEVRQESDASGGAVESGQNLEKLPGAQADPCCMGSAAMESLQVLEGFLEDERAGRQYLLHFADRLKNPRAVRVLRQIAAQKAVHVRLLAAAYYLITGTSYAHTIQVPVPAEGTYGETLRRAYHEAACLGLNYLRAADGTGDLCLQHMFQKMGTESFQQANQLLQLLSLSIR